MAWHLGYWSTFNFNYLEYANIGDLFKSSIYPLLSDTWVYLILCTVCVGIAAPMTLLITNKTTEPDSGKQTSTVGRTFLLVVIMTSTLSILAFGGILAPNNRKWDFMPSAFAVLFGTLLFLTKLGRNFILDDTNRLMLYIIILLIPFYSFGAAKKQSIKAKTMLKYSQVVAVETSDTTLSKAILNSAYLGKSSNNYFFYLPDKITVVNADKIESVTIEIRIDDRNYSAYKNY